MPPRPDSVSSRVDLRSVLDHAAVMVLVHDEAGRFVDVNEHACRVLGYTREELLPLSVFDVETEHRFSLGDHWDSFRVGEPKVMQGTHRTADGSLLPVEVRLSTFVEGGRKLFCAVCTPAERGRDGVEELTSYRFLEREVFRRIFEAATDAIAVIDHEGRYVRQNAAHLELLGYSDDALAGKTPAVHLGPAAFQEVAAALEREGTYVGEHVSRTSAGVDVRIELTAFAVSPGEGRPPLFVGIKRPMDERDRARRAEAERERRELEEGLRQAQKMEVIGRLAAGVAHDFNNLLTPILGYADAELGNLAEDEPVAEALRQILMAAERGRDLTQQLLAFGRKRMLQRQALALGPCIQRVTRMLQRVLPEDLVLEVDIAPQVDAVHADPAAMEQVLMNLVTNARDAVSSGGRVRIALRNRVVAQDDPLARTLGAGGTYVELSVSDDGHGMDGETLDRMFEPFFTRRPTGEGTGLGLSIVHGIVRQHDGAIQTTSEVGGGTIVRVILPRCETAPAPVPPLVDAELDETGATILVAEDEPQVRTLVARMLDEMGFQVLVAGNGLEALELAEGFPGSIDLLLTDVVMPGVGGRELYARLRATQPELNVLYMSGYPLDGLSHAGEVEEGVALIEKPFAAAELKARLRALLLRR